MFRSAVRVVNRIYTASPFIDLISAIVRTLCMDKSKSQPGSWMKVEVV